MNAARRLHMQLRGWVSKVPGGELTWRICVGVLGLAIILVGIALLPLPGPGWLVIFLGLGILASEFDWAADLLSFARRHVRAWTSWVTRQSRWVQLMIGAAGLVLVAGVAALVWWYSSGGSAGS